MPLICGHFLPAFFRFGAEIAFSLRPNFLRAWRGENELSLACLARAGALLSVDIE